MREPLDPLILKEALPEDIHATIDQVTANVNQSLNQVIQQFKDQTAQTLKDFEQQKYPEDLDKQLKQIQSDYDRDFNDLSVSIDRIKAAADKAAAASGSIGDMKTDIQRLSQDTEALKTKLADVRAKVSTFGQKAGGAIAAAAYKAFTGGIA